MGEVHQRGEGPHWTVVPWKRRRRSIWCVYFY